MTALLIAGTDTDVGKTFVTIALASYWQKYHLDRDRTQNLCIFKLMQTGTGDVELYNRLFNEEAGIEIVAPLRFAAPLAPPIAAAKEGKSIELGEVWQAFSTSDRKSSLVLLESLGGLGSPVTNELTVANIAADWRLPTVLVIPIKLGAIANVVANVALARSLNIDLKGIILNCSQAQSQEVEDLTPIGLIQSLTQTPVIGTLPYIENLAQTDKIASTVSNWDLELILPQGAIA